MDVWLWVSDEPGPKAGIDSGSCGNLALSEADDMAMHKITFIYTFAWTERGAGGGMDWIFVYFGRDVLSIRFIAVCRR